MTGGQSRSRAHSWSSILRTSIRPLWVIATLLVILGALAVRITMLDDIWLRMVLAGGDRMGILAKERQHRVDVERASKNMPANEPLDAADAATAAPVAEPMPR